MSTSQTPSPGTTPSGTTPNGGTGAGGGGPTSAPLRRRARPPADPLIRKKKLPLPAPRSSTAATTTQAGLDPKSNTKLPITNPHSIHPVLPPQGHAQGEYEDIPLYTTKRALLSGTRRHVMRLQPNASARIQDVDPSDESMFTRPVRLHRRDPRMNPLGNWKLGEDPLNSGLEDNTPPPSVEDDKERQRLEALKAERRAEREANMAQVAPAVKKQPTQQKKTNRFNKKKSQHQQVFNVDDPAKKKEMQLRYEEFLPWHLEDFDNQNIWAGTYEAALSENNILLQPEEQRVGMENAQQQRKLYRMVPVEKWYKFTAKNQFKALSIEEAEARMRKRTKDPRWFMETQRVNDKARKDEFQRRANNKLFTRKGERGETTFGSGGRTRRRDMDIDDDQEKPEISADLDNIDYDLEEDFADDEENELFGGNAEENQEAEDKIRREQLSANIFELKEEKDYDKEEEEEQQRVRDHKKLSKKVQKALMKREKNYVYEDDSDENPYASSSDSEDSETERLKEEEQQQLQQQQQKKDEDEVKSKDDLNKKSGDKIPSGASSKGTNTPSGRPKHLDPLRKSIKRPGSPNLSDASGNESSSRKKSKTKHRTSQPIDGSSVGATISRPVSPGNISSSGGGATSRKSSVIKLNVDPNKLDTISKSVPNPKRKFSEGSGSDADTIDGRRPKIVKGSPAASPNSSRAASPAATTNPNGGVGGTSKKPSTVALPSADAIRATVPPEGMTLNAFFQNFAASRDTAGYRDLILANAHWDARSKMLFPLGEAQRRKERKQQLRAQKEAAEAGTKDDGQSPGQVQEQSTSQQSESAS